VTKETKGKGNQKKTKSQDHASPKINMVLKGRPEEENFVKKQASLVIQHVYPGQHPNKPS
jgi:hypothetical protein